MKIKKILSLVLIFACLISIMATPVFAAKNTKLTEKNVNALLEKYNLGEIELIENPSDELLKNININSLEELKSAILKAKEMPDEIKMDDIHVKNPQNVVKLESTTKSTSVATLYYFLKLLMGCYEI